MTDVEQRLAGFSIALVVLTVAAWRLSVRRKRRRATELSQPLSPEWREILAGVPLYQRMPEELRAALEPVMRTFLADITFVGCQGLVVTDQMRLTIAMQACALVVRRDVRVYSELHSVLVYPEEFIVEESDIDEAGVVTEGSRAISGQTLDTDKIVLSWRDVQESGTTDDGYNVVLHEFAHYLDHSVDGALTARDADRHSGLATWHDVFDREYHALCDAVDSGEETLIDPYGAEDPAEFFAVATEAFFELPRELAHHHPNLYATFRDFYALDPADW
jgi:Mlc titration factor MtfA (ptsG expression regulator)